MAEFDINMDEVKFKPPLPVGAYTFIVSKANIQQANKPNAKTGNKEWYIAAELKPQEEPTYTVFHIWSLSTAALEVENAVVSLKAMYAFMGTPVGQRVNTDDLLNWKFVAQTKLEEGKDSSGNATGRLNPKLEKIISVAQ